MCKLPQVQENVSEYKSQLLVHLIGCEGGVSFLDQSQSIVK